MSANLFDVSGWTLGDLVPHESLKTPESRKLKNIKHKIKKRKQINEKGPTSKIEVLSIFEFHIETYISVKSWPVNPVDIFINYLKGKPKEWIVADLGCGEGKIAQEASNKVLSFDLVAKNSMIIACDIAK
ncbi:2695_t:CDS:2, partial [Racocetra fulgida]